MRRDKLLRESLQDIWRQYCSFFVSLVKAGTEKAALTLRVSINLHLLLYRENVGYFENKETVINTPNHVAKHTIPSLAVSQLLWWNYIMQLVKLILYLCRVADPVINKCISYYICRVFWFFLYVTQRKVLFSLLLVDKLHILVLLLSLSLTLHAISHQNILSQPLALNISHLSAPSFPEIVSYRAIWRVSLLTLTLISFSFNRNVRQWRSEPGTEENHEEIYEANPL